MLTETRSTFNGSTFVTRAYASFSEVIDAAQAQRGRFLLVTPGSIAVVMTSFGRTTHYVFTAA